MANQTQIDQITERVERLLLRYEADIVRRAHEPLGRAVFERHVLRAEKLAARRSLTIGFL